jgi:hypothetical protein
LIANVEEARYRALAAEDGLFLVEAHYAVRNNQRSFLKVTLPLGATIWSAAVGGRAVRPGVAEGRSVLLALEKGRAGEDAPTFVVRITYLQAVEAWADKARAHLELPALDLPISRTGVELYHSPRYRASLEPGSFREESDPGVFSEALRARGAGFGLAAGTDRFEAKSLDAVAMPPPPPSPRAPAPPSAAAAAPPGYAASVPMQPARVAGGVQTLIDRYRNAGGGRTVRGTLPVNVTFPAIGPSLFMASELTPEGQAPSFDLTIRRINK